MRKYLPRMLWLGFLMGKLWADDATFRDVGSRRKVVRRALLRLSEMPMSPNWYVELADRLGWSSQYDHAMTSWTPQIVRDWNEMGWTRSVTEGVTLTGDGLEIAIEEQAAERWNRRIFTWTLRKAGTVMLVVIGSVVAIAISQLFLA